MINSMTGFGRGEYEENGRKVTIEIKSVNHRYCEINVRQPRKLSFLENVIKNFIKQRVSRGKIDVFLSYEDTSEATSNIKYNEALAREYFSYFEKISKDFNIENDVRVSSLTRYPEVLILEEEDTDEDRIKTIVLKAVENALVVFNDSRRTEGEYLKKDILDKLNGLTDHVNHVKKFSVDVIEQYKEKLHNRIEELLEKTEIDESRLAQEVVIYADKTCIDEEIVRLEGHIEHMKKTLESNEPIGRKLDFIAQELNREANTVLSKTSVIDISNEGLALKTEIEKIREQIQNIE